jgi:hypothetical protein
MRQKSGPEKQPAEDAIKDIRRATRRHFSAEEKIRVVLEGLRGEESIGGQWPAAAGIADSNATRSPADRARVMPGARSGTAALGACRGAWTHLDRPSRSPRQARATLARTVLLVSRPNARAKWPSAATRLSSGSAFRALATALAAPGYSPTPGARAPGHGF